MEQKFVVGSAIPATPVKAPDLQSQLHLLITLNNIEKIEKLLLEIPQNGKFG